MEPDPGGLRDEIMRRARGRRKSDDELMSMLTAAQFERIQASRAARRAFWLRLMERGCWMVALGYSIVTGNGIPPGIGS